LVHYYFDTLVFWYTHFGTLVFRYTSILVH